MAGSPEDGGGGPLVGINITPLVDITLVLLIIFIVTAKVVVTPALPADLPRGASAQKVQVMLSIVVPATGPWSVDGAALPEPAAARDDALVLAARRAKAKNPDLNAVISAGAAVPHGVVFHVLDQLREAGVEHIAFGSLPEGP